MYCTNCGAKIDGNFCSNCGEKVENEAEVTIREEKKQTQHIKTENVQNDTILIKSENCNSVIEENKKEGDKKIAQYIVTVFIISALMFLSPGIIAVLNDKKLSQAENLPLPLCILILVMIILVLIVGFKRQNALQNHYNQYKQYCSTEVLVVDTGKVYGSTAKGTITLTYKQIESVRFEPNYAYQHEGKMIIQNDIFTVRDIVGNEFVFYSFSNCKELKTVIDLQIRRTKDGTM